MRNDTARRGILHDAILYFAFGGRLKNPKKALASTLKASTPITLVRTISSIVASLIAIIIPAKLMQYGYSQSEALAQFGIFMGMTMPIVMIPNTFTSSIAVALVPEISGYTNNIDKYGVKDLQGLSTKIVNTLQTVVVISFVLMSSFISLGTPICKVLFANSQAGKYLSVAAVLMLPMGLNQICSSMLNALGLELKALLDYGIGSIGLFLSIIFLPKYIGTYAIILGLGLMNTITCILSLKMLKKRNLINWSFIKTIGVCALICAITAVLSHLLFAL